MTTRINKYTTNSHRGFVQVCAEWQLITVISITTVILALNISFPNLSNPSTQSLSTYQTRLPTIQYRNPIPKFIYLSYLNPVNGLYLKGNDDIYFVIFAVLVWLTLRELCIKYFWTPIGRLLGLESNSTKLIKFAQQGWNLIYYAVFWSIGVKILSGYPDPIWSFNIRQYWAGYPQDSIPNLTKFYYLSQAAFWLHSMIVLNIEKHRKDHYQMLTHHVVTTLLICGSYALNITGIGSAIHTTMDFCDILLCISKMLNYLEAGLACDITFTVFMVSWVITRHIIFGKIIWSIYVDLPNDIPWVWDPSQGSFACTSYWIAFIVLLLFLQVLLLVWLRLILRIVWGVIIGNGAEDERSDFDESEIVTRSIDEKNGNAVEDDKEPLIMNTPRLESIGSKASKLQDRDLDNHSKKK